MVTLKQKNKANASCDQVILDNFWKICETSEERRVRSIHIILNKLNHQVKLKLPKNDISYCLERLIKGLVSAREFARHGFCVLLTKLLADFKDHVELKNALDIASREYGKDIFNSKPENAIAWSLFIGALLKSGIITVETDETILSKLYDLTFKLGTKKNYVEIIACDLMTSFFNILKSSEDSFEIIVSNHLKENEKEYKNSIFFKYCILLAHKHFPTLSSFATNFIGNHIYKKKSKDYSKAISLLKETTTYTPNVHPIIELLTTVILDLDDKDIEFCSKVTESIFKVNLEKTSLGFEIVKLFIKNIESDQVSLLNTLNVH